MNVMLHITIYQHLNTLNVMISIHFMLNIITI